MPWEEHDFNRVPESKGKTVVSQQGLVCGRIPLPWHEDEFVKSASDITVGSYGRRNSADDRNSNHHADENKEQIHADIKSPVP